RRRSGPIFQNSACKRIRARPMIRPSQSATRSDRASFEDPCRYQLHLAPRTLAAATRSAGQEILDQPREFRRLLHLGHVTAILDHDKPRARDGTLIDLAAIDWRISAIRP